jgi:two-component system cell cycle response regulator
MFLDLTMPVMDGIETLTRLRQSPETANLPVIILSGEKDQEAIEKVIRLGIADYVLKPPRTQAVIAKVEKVVSTLPPELKSTAGSAPATPTKTPRE